MTTESNDREQRLQEMQAKLDAAQAEQVDVANKIAALPGKFDESIPLPEDRKASESTADEVERALVVRDPWAGRNALQILRHPPGKRLRWISPTGREGRGMRGYTAVRYDDAIGRELDLYIVEPPSRMEGLTEIGAVVRRGDVVLAWIDEGIAVSRERDVRLRTSRGTRTAMARGQKEFGPHGRSIGDGLEDDPDPSYRQRPAPGFVSPKRAADYRANAQGDARNPRDTRIAVEGRNLLEPREPS